jgi:hypothetical protein
MATVSLTGPAGSAAGGTGAIAAGSGPGTIAISALAGSATGTATGAGFVQTVIVNPALGIGVADSVLVRVSVWAWPRIVYPANASISETIVVRAKTAPVISIGTQTMLAFRELPLVSEELILKSWAIETTRVRATKTESVIVCAKTMRAIIETPILSYTYRVWEAVQ